MKNYRSYKTLLTFLCLILGAIGAARLSHSATSGFRLSKIQDNFFDCAHKTEESAFIPEGPFTYLGRGLQSFAFVSADGNYVLKLFNNRYQRALFWLQQLPFCRERADKILAKLQRTATSYSIAINTLREETGILYAHLQPTSNLPKSIKIIDKLGIVHTIDLNTHSFVIQKKVTLVYPQLLKWKEDNDLVSAQSGISSLIQLIKARFDKGITDSDPLIRTNFGFCETKAVHIDIGAFSLAPQEHPQQEFERIFTSLKLWVSAHYPELLPHLDKEIYAHVF